MHITTPITQSTSRLTTSLPHSKTSNILPLKLKKVITHSQEVEHDLILSTQLTRLLDACGDCV